MRYEFKCDDCRESWTVSRAVKDRNDKSACPSCQVDGYRAVSAASLIFMDADFPSNDFKEGAFWRPDGRTTSFHEREFLDREASDDASAAPDTVVNVAKQKAAAAA